MKNLTDNQRTWLMLGIAIIFGTWLRITPALLSGFPINDGGMFYTMIADLGNSHYLLPDFTTYNGSHIPFAYPPFGFYLARVLVDLIHIPIIQILQWLPVFISIVVIFAYYLLASKLLTTRLSADIATIIFSFSSRSISWFIMGGGLTRVLGQLFMLLTLYGAFRLFKEPSKKYLSLSILFGSLTILSHPEAAIQTVGAAFLLWLTIARNKTAFLSGIKVSIAIIILTSVWWGTIILRHGAVPLLRAGQTGFSNLALALIPFHFTDEPMMTFVSVLGIVGIFKKISQRDFFLSLWIVVSFLIDPRSAAWVAIVPLSMLAAMTIAEIILPALSIAQSATSVEKSFTPLISVLFSIYVLGYLLVGTYIMSLSFASIHLDKDHMVAMEWIKIHTPIDSQFVLLVPGTDYPMRDPVQEWFPALTERTSLTTIQGQEWILGPKFSSAINNFRALQACATQDVACLKSQPIISNQKIDFIYISKSINGQQCNQEAKCDAAKRLIESAKSMGQFKSVFENHTVIILEAMKFK